MLGRVFYIMKRRLKWIFSSTKFAKVSPEKVGDVVFEHKSTLLRKLKDVEMYLQYNKITNLRIAISHIDGVVIRPGETFSIWRMVGCPSTRKGYKTGMMIHNGKYNITSATVNTVSPIRKDMSYGLITSPENSEDVDV